MPRRSAACRQLLPRRISRCSCWVAGPTYWSATAACAASSCISDGRWRVSIGAPTAMGCTSAPAPRCRSSSLVTEAIARDLTGLEFAEGIPGTVGGGLLMNAGAFGGEIGDVVEYVDGVDAYGELQRFPRSALRFGYRRFDLPPGFIVTRLEFLLHSG